MPSPSLAPHLPYTLLMLGPYEAPNPATHAVSAPYSAPTTQLWTLDNGLRVAFEQRQGAGFALDLRVPVGSAHDPLGGEGAAAVLEEWLFRGAGGLDSRKLQDAFDDLGVRRSGGVGPEATRFGVSGLLGDFEAALKLVAAVLLRPHLPEAELPALLDLARQDLEGLQDSPTDLLAVQARALAFAGGGETHSGYAHPVSGTLAGLEHLSAGRLRAHFQTYGAQGSILGIVGDLPAPLVQEAVQQAFGAWQAGQDVRVPAPFWSGLQVHFPYAGGEQTHLQLLAPGVAPRHPAWLTWQLVLTALAGGSSSRLFQAVREERGLAYAVSASPLILAGEGYLNVYAGGTPQRIGETLAVLEEELARLSLGLTPAEFGRARTGLETSVVFGGESLRSRAYALTRDLALFGRVRSLAHLRAELSALTLAGVNGFLEEYVPLAQASRFTLGPEA